LSSIDHHLVTIKRILLAKRERFEAGLTKPRSNASVKEITTQKKIRNLSSWGVLYVPIPDLLAKSIFEVAAGVLRRLRFDTGIISNTFYAVTL